MDDFEKAKISRQSKLQRQIICEVQKLSYCSFFQDATLLCSDGSLKFSKFLLASIFPVIRNILKTQGQEKVVMSLPDASTVEFTTFFEDLLNEKSEIIIGDTIKSLLYDATAKKESRQDIEYEPRLEPKEGDEIMEYPSKSKEKINFYFRETDEDINFEELDPLCDDIKAEIVFSEEEKDSFKLEEKKQRRKVKKRVRIPDIPQNEDGRFMCTRCGRDFPRAENVRLHQNRKNICVPLVDRKQRLNLPIYKCLVQNCEFEAGGKDLKHHLETEHPKQRLVCNHCGKDFHEFSKLLTHIRGVHMNRRVQRRFPCNICGKNNFPREAHLKRHIEAVHNDKLEMIDCDRCQKKFKPKSFKVHKCFRDEVCNICGKSVNNLKGHMESVHNFTLVQCPICGVSLKESSLRCHMKSHNEKITCPTCGITVKHLANHIKIVHTENEKKKFQCLDCGKGFIDKTHLQKHRINAHLKTYPYHCRYGCEMKYNDISNRNSHEKKKHGGLYQVTC